MTMVAVGGAAGSLRGLDDAAAADGPCADESFMAEADGPKEDEHVGLGRGARQRKVVSYADSMSDKAWLDSIEDGTFHDKEERIQKRLKKQLDDEQTDHAAVGAGAAPSPTLSETTAPGAHKAAEAPAAEPAAAAAADDSSAVPAHAALSVQTAASASTTTSAAAAALAALSALPAAGSAQGQPAAARAAAPVAAKGFDPLTALLDIAKSAVVHTAHTAIQPPFMRDR